MLAMLMLAMVQNVPGPPGDDVTALPRLTPQTQRQCPRGSDEIMVCGGGLESQRLEPLPEMKPDPILPRAEAQLSPNKRIGLRAGSSSNPMITAPRGMVDLTIKF